MFCVRLLSVFGVGSGFSAKSQSPWNDYVIDTVGGASLIYIDRHLVREVTSPQAFEACAGTGASSLPHND
jgi:hypothetical protein